MRASALRIALPFWLSLHRVLSSSPPSLTLPFPPCSVPSLARSGGLTIRDVVAGYNEWEQARKHRVRRARARALEALSGGNGTPNPSRDDAQSEDEASLARFKKGLAKVRAGKLDTVAFVEFALSPAFFGSDGWGALSGSAQHAAVETAHDTELGAPDELADMQATEGMAASAPPSAPADGEAELLSPLVALLQTLPDERAALRDELLLLLSERGLRVV
jgi:hypothetical protein